VLMMEKMFVHRVFIELSASSKQLIFSNCMQHVYAVFQGKLVLSTHFLYIWVVGEVLNFKLLSTDASFFVVTLQK